MGGEGKGTEEGRGGDLLLRRGARRGEGVKRRGGLAPKPKNQTSPMAYSVSAAVDTKESTEATSAHWPLSGPNGFRASK